MSLQDGSPPLNAQERNESVRHGSSRIQHFEAPVDARKTYRRRYSEIPSGPSADVILSGGFDLPSKQKPRKSLDEAEFQSTMEERKNDLPDIVAEAMRKRGSRGSVSGASTDSADAKGKKYAEMMERFQVRRLSRTTSLLHSTAQPASASGYSGTTSIRHSGSARDMLEAPAKLTPSKDAQNESNQANRPLVPPLVPPLGSLSARLEKAFTEFGSRGDLDSTAHTPREGTGRSDRSIRFSLHWLLISWRRRVMRAIAYVAQNISKPISPSSGLSRIRLIALILAFAVHVILFPLEIAFLPEGSDVDSGETIEVVIEIVLVVDLLLMFNTAYYNKKNRLVTSRRLIARNYLRGWFVPDLLSSVPVDLILMMTNGASVQSKWLHFTYDVAFRSQRIIHIVRIARFMWTVLLDSPERSVFEWLLYSRYSHLLRIASIILFIVLIAHYLACGWRLLFSSTPMRGSPLEEYVACFYDVLQLLQGQGVPTTTVAQNIYAAVAILMGSVALAIIFGNVAILVSNFNANSTNYQRKMESVFAIMSKLQLPAPLRERIHQYYEHLWREYESLDGEIVAFSKGLSHTLELEVVLFKYMDLIMHVPFWRDGSPDFQKQLMLSLHVRVYLPDDFIIRRGEVGDEFFMINRGICELALGPDSFECTIEPLHDEPDSSYSEAEGENNEEDQLPKTARYQLPTARRPDGPPAATRSRRGSRANIYALGAPTSARVAAETSSKYIKKLRRGQSFGEIALLMNYERTANVRALTYVEMCVLHRADFQDILIKHPKDRKQVIAKMLTKTMENNEATKVWCPLKATVQSVFGEGDQEKAETISAMHAALLISNAINLPLDDTSIKFGVGVRLREQLVELRDKQHHNSTKPQAVPPVSTTNSEPPAPIHVVESSIQPPPAETHKLAEHVQQLEHVQTHMASTMMELAQEVHLLRTANEQLLKTISVLEARLSEPLCTGSTAAMATSSPATSTQPSLRPATRRLSRKLSQGSIEDMEAASIPENHPRVMPFTLMRSASMSSIHSARSVAVSCGTGRETQGPGFNESTDESGHSEVGRTGRRASYANVVRSQTMRNLPATAAAHVSSKPLNPPNANRPSEPYRSSLNTRILIPLRSLLTPDSPGASTQSPTRYADQLFRSNTPKRS